MENLIILPERKISRLLQATGFVFFGVLFYFSWAYYLERMLYVDNAFYSFQLIQSGTFTANLNRYGDFIPQILPYVAMKLGANVGTILLLYSVSFIVLHYLIFLFVTLVLKNNGAGIALMLASCLAYFHAFYTPLVQLNESIIAAVMLWAFVHPETPFSTLRERKFYMVGAIATLVYMSFLHPLGIVAIIFVFGVEIIGAKRWKDKFLWYTLLIGGGWFLLKVFVLFRSQYDRDHMVPLSEMLHQLPHWKDWPSTVYMDKLTIRHFRSLKWVVAVLVLFSLRKGILFFLFVLSFIVMFTLIYFVTMYKGESEVYYEDYYCYYGFFAGLLFSFLIYHPGRKNFAIILAIPLLYSGLHRINLAHPLFTDRVGYISRIVHKAERTKEKKCIIDEKCYPYDYAMVPWNVSFETLLYSSLHSPDSSVTVFIKKPDFEKACAEAVVKPGSLLGVHFALGWYSQQALPDDYFGLPNTAYTYITHGQEDTNFHEEIFSADNIKISPLVKTIKIKTDDWTSVVPVKIMNTSGKEIPAIPRAKNPVYLTYTLYDAAGNVKDRHNETLETDIGPESEQGVIIYYPVYKGTYYAQIDMMTEGKRDNWNIPSARVKIKVE